MIFSPGVDSGECERGSVLSILVPEMMQLIKYLLKPLLSFVY